MQNPQEKSFGQLLREYREKSYDRRAAKWLSQQRLAILLSKKTGRIFDRNKIGNWERDVYRIDKDDTLLLKALIKVLCQAGGIETLDQANAMLEAGNYRKLKDEEVVEINPDWTTERDTPFYNGELAPPFQEIKPLWPPSIPDDPYYPLPGREKELDTLLDYLRGGEKSGIIVIDGLGGQGKTAIGTELVRRALSEKLFDGLVGDSAKLEIFSEETIVQIREATLNFESLLDAIARQLERWELTTLAVEDKLNTLARFFQQNRYLIFVDNLETAENASSLVARLQGLLGGSQIVVTSREQVHHNFIKSISLNGLDQADSLLFIQNEAERDDVEQILAAPKDKLIKIAELTGGAPLALKLIVAQGKRFDLDVLLKRLDQASSKLYSFIYQQSWEQLSYPAQKILIYIGKTVVTTVSWEELTQANLAETDTELTQAIDQLTSLSLLNTYYSSGNIRYGIHQLTRQFINGDLPTIWREQGLL